MVGLTASQVVDHPAYPYVARTFTPTSKGKAQRNGCNIAYEIHGIGPKKLVV